MAAWVTDTRHPGKALKAIKAAIAVWGYLNDQEVRRSHVKIAANVRTIIKETENAILARQGTSTDLTGAWDQWIADVMSFQVTRTYGWVHEQIGETRRVWEAQLDTNQLKNLVLREVLWHINVRFRAHCFSE